jgi:ABC-type antimicrobial peptide transport system permease subunit
MNDWISDSSAQPRLNAVLVASFGCLALSIAAIGVYGVSSYRVTQRRGEIRLRLALGGRRFGVLRLVLRDRMLLAFMGIAIGLVAAWLAGFVLSSLLYDVQARDLATFVNVALALSLVALAACIAPVLRASKIDPIVAIRQE